MNQHVPRWPRPMTLWPVSEIAWMTGPGEGLSPLLNTVQSIPWILCSALGPSLTTGRTLNMSREGEQSRQRVWSTNPIRSSWGRGCLGWRKGGSKDIFLIVLYIPLNGGCSEVGVSLFFQVTNDRMRQNCLNLHQGRLILNIRKKSLTESVFRPQATQEVVESPSLQVFECYAEVAPWGMV